MNSIITPVSACPQPIVIIETVPVGVQLRMTPDEIREFVAKARARDAEAREKKLAEKAAEKEKTD